MHIPIYQVDAFTDRIFRGNPAAVCPLVAWPDEAVLQGIASENNLAETAFFLGSGGSYELRWFTPQCEVDLCGHATLASAHVLFEHREPHLNEAVFSTLSGLLQVTRQGEFLCLDFPSRPPSPVEAPPELTQALGRTPMAVFKSRDYLALYASPADILALKPDMQLLAGLDCLGTIVSAPGEVVDFVSRFFAPGVGIPEDPVTGSAHCTLVPYWARRLGKSTLRARQLSARGGELLCELKGERVKIAGRAVTYLEGVIHV